MVASASGELWLVRHGETDWSRIGRHTGKTDLPLTERGRSMATQLAARLRDVPFERVLVSPLLRARETCELAGFAGRAEVWPDLAEWDYGRLEGYTDQDFAAAHPGWALWVDGGPGGESVEAVGMRADRVVEALIGAPGNVIAFGHGHFSRIVGARWAGLPANAGRVLDLGPTGVSRLGRSKDGRVILHWNDDSHLRAK
jgi:broad specificity phosphatase PhoE